MGPKKTTPEEAARIIEAFGGTAAVARLCHIRSASVSGWKKQGMPMYRVQFLRLLRPDVFGEANKNDLSGG